MDRIFWKRFVNGSIPISQVSTDMFLFDVLLITWARHHNLRFVTLHNSIGSHNLRINYILHALFMALQNENQFGNSCSSSIPKFHIERNHAHTHTNTTKGIGKTLRIERNCNWNECFISIRFTDFQEPHFLIWMKRRGKKCSNFSLNRVHCKC